jgi:hypothetical protein
MRSNQGNTGALAQLGLALAFLTAGLVFALAGWMAWTEHGFSATTILAAVTVLGTISLTLRSVKSARELAGASSRRNHRGK